jgi:hypothetical protein
MSSWIPQHMHNESDGMIRVHLIRMLDRISQKNKNRKRALKGQRIAIDRLQLQNNALWRRNEVLERLNTDLQQALTAKESN